MESEQSNYNEHPQRLPSSVDTVDSQAVPSIDSAVSSEMTGDANNAMWTKDAEGMTGLEPFPVVGIGASAGGLKALESFFQHLPETSGMAFVIVQHLSPDYKSELVMLLQRHTSMEVIQITEDMAVQPNVVYVIPPNKVLTIQDGRLQLTQRHRESRKHGPIDAFFTSLASERLELAVAIVLSGTGSDGSIGIKAIKEQGGITMAQRPEDAEYDGMPRSAIATNCVELIGSTQDLAEWLVNYHANVKRIRVPSLESTLADDGTSVLAQILILLHDRVGHDFSAYKETTILRRIGRRMRITDIDTMADYLSVLKQDKKECKALFHDFLISVTNFFRDPEVFQAVAQTVVEQIVPVASSKKQLRIWVPGCATGEEVYSLAMLVDEVVSKRNGAVDVQFFATDIDQDALAFAEKGFYPDSIAANVSAERLLRYFTRESGGYRIKKSIREQILFANHSLISDPPFSRLDFISCRNLLIYLSRTTQEKIFALFHYALRADGYLLLGTSESAESVSNLFASVDQKHRIFQRKEAVRNQPAAFALPKQRTVSIDRNRLPSGITRQGDPNLTEGYQQWRLQHHAPPVILVDEQYNLVHLYGSAGRYLQIQEGPATLNILDAILPELRLRLRTALYDAVQNRLQTEHTQRVTIQERDLYLHLRVGPVEQPQLPDNVVEIVFMEFPAAFVPSLVSKSSLAGDDTNLAERLEEELIRTKEQLQTTVEEYESSNEELQASNEELQSMNEELQSTTEQLETSKEELQSVNEELIIVNQELKEKVDELDRANSDLQNLMASTEIATLFVDRELKIQRYTPKTEEIFNIMPMDVGRPLMHLSHRLRNDSLPQDVQEVLNTLVPKEFEVAAEDGRWYMTYMIPYRTSEDKIDGVVASFVDISKLKAARDALAEREIQQTMVAKLGRLAIEGMATGDLLSTALHEISQHLDIDYGDVWVLDDDNETLRLQELYIADEQLHSFSSPERFPRGARTQADYVLASATPTIFTQLDREERFEPAPYLLERGLTSGVNLVIPGAANAYGIIGLYTSETWYHREENIDFLLGLFHLVGEAIGRKRSEQELRALQAELEERVLIRTSELERSNDELDRFAYVASHDLKAPLRAITNLATWTIEDANEHLPKTSRDHLVKLLGRVERMQQLLEDLLLYSRADRFRHTPEWVDGEALVRDALNLVDIPPEFTVKIAKDMPGFHAEWTPLELTLRNLIGNAIKHHDRRDGTVEISAVERDDVVEFTVRDDGPGIADEYHDRIFAMFQTLRPRDEVEGSGLGLAIVKKTIESRGGIITVKSQKGKGTMFRFTWPLQTQDKRNRITAE